MAGGGFSLSGAFSRSRSSSQSQSTSIDSVFNPQYFTSLFSDASRVAGGIDSAGLTERANQLFGSGMSFLSELQTMSGSNGAGGTATDYLSGRISGANPLLDQNIGALGEDIGKFFNEQLLPGIRGDAIAAGTLGGGRSDVLTGQATEASLREFQRGATALRTADLAARDAAAGQLGQLSLGSAGLNLQAAGAGLSALPGVLGIADLGANASLSPYLALAQILGDPTVLNSAQSTSSSKSKSNSYSLATSGNFSIGGMGG